MIRQEIESLERAIDEITEIAKGFGLDFYPMRYEICPADILYTFGAYGMPTRFSHWSFGKTFHRMKTQYDYGLSKIYELVINSNPCYAFLLEGNSLIQNKLIVAHVLAHCDFFKNNVQFSRTNRHMVESMSATAERIREYELTYGVEAVETFLDAVLAIQEHVDPSLIGPKHGKKDLLLFIETNSSSLTHWQRDILTMLREEMLYFWPQLETKIMNEGWATYWHLRILREMELTPEETIEFAKLHAMVVQPSRNSLNPYYLGLRMFEDIEKRWNHPTIEEQTRLGRTPGQGRRKLFEVREFESDCSFIRNYVTKALVDDLDLYIFEKQGVAWTITDQKWENVRDQLVYSRVNGGFPYLVVENCDYEGSGALYLKHSYEGIELEVKDVERTLPSVYHLWRKPVYLETVIDQKQVWFAFDGTKHLRKFL